MTSLYPIYFRYKDFYFYATSYKDLPPYVWITVEISGREMQIKADPGKGENIY